MKDKVQEQIDKINQLMQTQDLPEAAGLALADVNANLTDVIVWFNSQEE
jgi:hypothetical protein